jgi:aromatic-L-amino-acid decarboxylase
MLLTPMDCSAFFTRKPETLRQAFSLIPEYLRTEDHPRVVNLMDYGVPLGRRFRSLKLWFVMRAYGREGMAEVMRGHVRLAQIIKRAVDEDSRFECVAPAPFSVVCFRYKGTDEENKRIQERVNSTGDMFISGTVLNGRYTLRLAIGNLATRREHVERAWELISKAVE